jgi:hypothetical protein
MAKQIIDIGTSPNKGDGDPLRSAFTKINNNFNEVYTALGDPSGATSHVLPNTDGTIDLGSADKQWDDIYVKNFIYVNGARIEVTSGGALLVNGGAPAEVQDTVGSVFGDDSTLLVDGVNSSIPKANIEDSTNWDTAFGWGNHSTAGYADGTNEANWNTAFGWGNHSTAGYLTSYTVTESDVTTHQTALSITESQITDLAHYDDTALATRVSTLENAGYITSETDSQELTLVGTDLSISSGNTVDLSGFLTSVPAQTFASLTGTPTTIAGYGITDALALGTTATTALAGDTALFDGAFASLTGKPTTLAGYGITDGGASFDQDLNTTNDVTFNSAALSSTLNLAVLAAAPSNPVNGMVAVADGTNWDPMSNAVQTMVVYLGGVWRQIAVAGV